MRSLVISPMELSENTVEVVERKGLGHPDTICDAQSTAFPLRPCHSHPQATSPTYETLTSRCETDTF
jgi:hypothetical protein